MQAAEKNPLAGAAPQEEQQEAQDAPPAFYLPEIDEHLAELNRLTQVGGLACRTRTTAHVGPGQCAGPEGCCCSQWVGNGSPPRAQAGPRAGACRCDMPLVRHVARESTQHAARTDARHAHAHTRCSARTCTRTCTLAPAARAARPQEVEQQLRQRSAEPPFVFPSTTHAQPSAPASPRRVGAGAGAGPSQPTARSAAAPPAASPRHADVHGPTGPLSARARNPKLIGGTGAPYANATASAQAMARSALLAPPPAETKAALLKLGGPGPVGSPLAKLMHKWV